MSFRLPDPAFFDDDDAPGADRPGLDLAQGFGAALAELHNNLGGSVADATVIARTGAAVSRAVSDGNACLPLDALESELMVLALRASPVVALAPAETPTPPWPLILDRDRLYLQRYWRYETRLAQTLRSLDEENPIAPEEAMKEALDGVFGEPQDSAGGQRFAAATALKRRLTVITGGPGTGKTRTVARLIAAVAALKPEATIALAAPTGKAALRLEQSVKQQLSTLPLEGLAASLVNLKAVTVHRLLGARYGGVSFRHDAKRPLTFDVVVIDEASMLDLALAAKLVEALPTHARLVLLGDADQLASVETGAVFAELASMRDPSEPTAPAPAWPLQEAVVELTVSYRYQSGGAIGRFAAAVRDGDVTLALSLLEFDPASLCLKATALDTETQVEQLLDGFSEYLTATRDRAHPRSVLYSLEKYRVLCALRRGPTGSLLVNAALELAYRRRLGLIDGTVWYPGRPVIVTQNDPLLKLFNGDIGVALADDDGRMLVYFEDGETVRAIAPGRLPNCETAFALTIHKSQGSEFDAIDIILPPLDSPLASRELIYTAVTRARRSVSIWGTEAALSGAIERRSRRNSALAERLRDAAQ